MTELAETMDQSSKAMDVKQGKYLTFTMANEEYGIGILKIKEIIGMMPVTTIPQTPEFVQGIINLRGKVIPVVDLRLRFGIEAVDYTDRTCIIVLEALTSNMGKCWESKQCKKEKCPAYGNKDLRCWMISGTYCRDEIQGSFHEKIEACRQCDFYQDAHGRKAILTMGIVVDAVSEVLNINEEDVEETPTFGTKLNTDYILGIAKMEGGIKILLDIDRVFKSEELAGLDKKA